MNVLFIGGTGNLSSVCSELAIQKGITLYHLNRGQSFRKVEGVNWIPGDIAKVEEVRNTLKDYRFDVVVNWICYTPEQVILDLEMFAGKISQYIFISSASAYQKPPEKLPITEETPLDNPYWQYSRDKIACEKLLMYEYRKHNFPATIVRPAHTYDVYWSPNQWGYTALDRIKKGKKIIIPGDGTSLWTLTHHRDFARGFAGLIGNQQAIGEAFHITSDHYLTWNKIYALIARELGVELHPVHIPSDFIGMICPGEGSALLGDNANSMIYDNSKIKRFVPEFQDTIKFDEGVKEMIWTYGHYPEMQVVDPVDNWVIDKIIEKYEAAR